jgi:hypothetical protein
MIMLSLMGDPMDQGSRGAVKLFLRVSHVKCYVHSMLQICLALPFGFLVVAKEKATLWWLSCLHYLTNVQTIGSLANVRL